MSERENVTKIKIKKLQEKYLNLANLAIQEFYDAIDSIRMMLIQCYMLVQKQFNLNLELYQKRKENLTKIKTQSGKLILKRTLKR